MLHGAANDKWGATIDDFRGRGFAKVDCCGRGGEGQSAIAVDTGDQRVGRDGRRQRGCPKGDVLLRLGPKNWGVPAFAPRVHVGEERKEGKKHRRDKTMHPPTEETNNLVLGPVGWAPAKI